MKFSTITAALGLAVCAVAVEKRQQFDERWFEVDNFVAGCDTGGHCM